MGHIFQMRNRSYLCKHMCTNYDYTIMLNKEKKIVITFLRIKWAFLFEQTWILLSTKYALCQVWLKLAQVREKILFIYFKFSCFNSYFSLEKGSSLFKQTWNTSIQGWFLPSLVEIGPIAQVMIFKISWMYYHYSVYTSEQITQGCFVSSLVKIGL